MELRDYQKECINAVISELHESRQALCVLATGSGKSVIFSQLMQMVHDKNRSVLCLVQKNILVKQTIEHFKRFINDVSIYNAGLKQKKFGQVTVASIQSIARAEDIPEFAMVIVDEIHKYAINNENSQVRKVLKLLKEKNERMITLAFTATPFDGKKLLYGEDKFFKKVTFEKSIEELTDGGYLAPIRYKGENSDKTKIDVSSVAKRAGEFIDSALQKTILDNKDKILAQIEDALIKSDGRKKIIALTTGIAHAEFVYSILPNAAIVHSKRKDRDEQLSNFMSGDARILISVLVASEGFDAPAADCLWMFRPTRSYTLYIQAAGRILRSFPGKEDGLFLDYGEIIKNLGKLYEACENAKNQKDKKEEDDLKICPMCGEYNSKKAMKCTDCEHVFCRPCEGCFEMTPLGNSVCIHCGHDHKRVIDSLKNTTLKAYEVKSEWREVTNSSVSMHTSKAGNECYKIEYWCGGMHPVVTEYLMPWAVAKYIGLHSLTLDEYVAFTIAITIRKENGYKKVKNRRIECNQNVKR